MSVNIITGDCLEVLRTLPDASVHCCVTSPPYWGLRDYGHAGQLGLEPTPHEYVANMVRVFSEVKRVLRDDGTLWLNLGDSYSGSGKGGNPEEGKQATNKGSQSIGVLYGKTGETAREAALTNVSRRWTTEQGIRPKQLIGIPWRVAFALQADGWYLRSDIIWHKPNPMPESCRDRPTKSHEYLFLLSKSARYFYDFDAIAEPVSASMLAQIEQGYSGAATKDFEGAGVQDASVVKSRILGKHRKPAGWDTGDGAHGTIHRDGRAQDVEYTDVTSITRNRRTVWTIPTKPFTGAHFATFPPDLIEPCIKAGCPIGGTVLDPFGGAGTTGLVADRLQRNAILIELNPQYADMARGRVRNDSPLFTEVA